MISYIHIFKRYNNVHFVLPKDGKLIKSPSIISGCRMFSVENVDGVVKHIQYRSTYDYVSVNGHKGWYSYITISKQTYNKLWKNTPI